MRRLAALAILAAVTPARAGPPYATDDPDPVEPGHWEINLFSSGTIVRGDAAGTAPTLEFNYGAAPGVQLHLGLPAAYNVQSGFPSAYGVGDISLGTKLRLLDPAEGEAVPEIAIYPTVLVSSGSGSRGLGTGRPHVLLPVWLQKSFGSWIVDAGAGYWLNPGPGNRDYAVFGVSLQNQITRALAIGAEFTHQTASTTATPGTPGYPLGTQASSAVNAGLIWAFTEHYRLLLSAGTGVQNATRNDQFSYFAGLQWAF